MFVYYTFVVFFILYYIAGWYLFFIPSDIVTNHMAMVSQTNILSVYSPIARGINIGTGIGLWLFIPFLLIWLYIKIFPHSFDAAVRKSVLDKKPIANENFIQSYKSSYQETVNSLAKFSAIVCAILIIPYLMSLNSYVKVEKNDIVVKPVFSFAHSYQWKEISSITIEANYTYNRKRGMYEHNFDYNLHFKDGRTVDIWDYKQVKRILTVNLIAESYKIPVTKTPNTNANIQTIRNDTSIHSNEYDAYREIFLLRN